MYTKRNPFQLFRVIVYIIFAFSLICLDAYWSFFQVLRTPLERIQIPIYWMVSAPTQTYQHFKEYLQSKQKLFQENQMLQGRLLLLTAKMAKYDALRAENQRLYILLRASAQKPQSLTLAQLVQVQTDPFSHHIIINKGKDVAFEGQAIMDAYGIMGIVKEVGVYSSKILLITDPRMGIPVKSLRSGARAIVYGTGSFSILEIKNVSKTADFRVGDKLVTSGLDGLFFADYPVGTIKELARDPYQSFNHWYVKPAAKFNLSTEVLLIGTNQEFDAVASNRELMDQKQHESHH